MCTVNKNLHAWETIFFEEYEVFKDLLRHSILPVSFIAHNGVSLPYVSNLWSCVALFGLVWSSVVLYGRLWPYFLQNGGFILPFLAVFDPKDNSFGLILETNQYKNNCLLSNFYDKLKFSALFSARNRWEKSERDFNLL